MKDKLRELAERWRKDVAEIARYPHLTDIAMARDTDRKELLAILDAEGDGVAVDFPRYRATGFDAETNCAEMVADPDGAWVHVMDIPQVHPARSGVVSEEDVEEACRKYYNCGHPVYPPVFEGMRAALEHFARRTP